jgi:3-O-methylgallate 3,4-dioxygenase
MARVVAGFAASHSPMVAARAEDWVSGAFGPRDRARALVGLDGAPCRYDDALARAPADAMDRIAPDRLAARHAQVQAALARLRADVAAAALDALIIVGDDQEEVFDPGSQPAIGIYYGPTIRNAQAAAPRDPVDAARQRFQEPDGDAEYPCHAPLARYLLETLTASGFDPAAIGSLPAGRTEGHAYSFAHKFCMSGAPVPLVPLFLNAYYPPNQPTPARCYALGEAIAEAVAAFPGDARVGIMASGGLSHFLVDEALDRAVLDALARKDADALRGLPLAKLQSGSSEIRNWICLGGAVAHLDLDWAEYVPGYRTPALTGTGLGFARFA